MLWTEDTSASESLEPVKITLGGKRCGERGGIYLDLSKRPKCRHMCPHKGESEGT